MISEDALIKILNQISNVDKSPDYEYFVECEEYNNANGMAPKPGCRWCTPKEICQQYLRDIEHGRLDESIEQLMKDE